MSLKYPDFVPVASSNTEYLPSNPHHLAYPPLYSAHQPQQQQQQQQLYPENHHPQILNLDETSNLLNNSSPQHSSLIQSSFSCASPALTSVSMSVSASASTSIPCAASTPSSTAPLSSPQFTTMESHSPTSSHASLAIPCSVTESVNSKSSFTPKKSRRRKSRRGLEKKFPCLFQGCEKRYSRAEHLNRHQLNHNPKQIFRCNFPHCNRSFVRQDLCIRHLERHNARKSLLSRSTEYITYPKPMLPPPPPPPPTSLTKSTPPLSNSTPSPSISPAPSFISSPVNPVNLNGRAPALAGHHHSTFQSSLLPSASNSPISTFSLTTPSQIPPSNASIPASVTSITASSASPLPLTQSSLALLPHPVNSAVIPISKYHTSTPLSNPSAFLSLQYASPTSDPGVTSPSMSEVSLLTPTSTISFTAHPSSSPSSSSSSSSSSPYPPPSSSSPSSSSSPPSNLPTTDDNLFFSHTYLPISTNPKSATLLTRTDSAMNTTSASSTPATATASSTTAPDAKPNSNSTNPNIDDPNSSSSSNSSSRSNNSRNSVVNGNCNDADGCNSNSTSANLKESSIVSTAYDKSSFSISSNQFFTFDTADLDPSISYSMDHVNSVQLPAWTSYQNSSIN